MVAITMRAFIGMQPARDVRLLPNEVAKTATNIRPEGGALKPTNRPKRLVPTDGMAQQGMFQPETAQDADEPLNDLDPATRRVFRIPAGVDILDLEQSFWIEFSDPDTTVLRTPIQNDSFDRYYWCSPSEGFRFNTRLRLQANSPSYKVGVPAPTAAPELATSGGGSGSIFTRSYVTTFVNIYGEEGQPSPPVEADGYSDSDWVLTAIEQPPDPSDYAPINRIRVYRTITSASGTTTFFRVTELTGLPTSSYTDTDPDTLVSGRPQLPSTIWAVPPDMEGIIAMPNGIFVGFKGSNLYFCDNYRPHAWPVEFQLSVQYPIVGLGVFGNTCVVCTQGQPAAVTGSRSETMSLVTNTATTPCLSRGSIVSTLAGVVFASENGLVLFGPSGLQEITKGLIDRNEWRNEYRPDALRAALVEDKYFAVRQIGGDFGSGFIFDPGNPQAGISDITDIRPDVVPTIDPWTGRPLIVQDVAVFELLPADHTPSTAVWRSKEFRTVYPLNFGAAKVFFDEVEDGFVRLRVFARGDKIFDEDITSRSNHIRLPSGFKADVWQFEVETNTRVHSVDIAEAFSELRGV